jgi:hypothetical protein
VLTARVLAMPLLVMATATVAGCDSTPTTPSSIGGTWGGSTCNPPSHINSCVITLTISQSSSALSGTYGTTSGHGTLTGTLVGAVVTMSMTPIFPSTACQWTVNATVTGDQITGTTNVNCTRPLTNSGFITLTRSP